MNRAFEIILELDDKLQRATDQRITESMKSNHIIPGWYALQHLKQRGPYSGEEAGHILTVAQREGYLEPLSSTECKNALGGDWKPSNGSYLRILQQAKTVVIPVPLEMTAMPVQISSGVAPAGTTIVSWRPVEGVEGKVAGFDAHGRFVEGSISSAPVPAAPQAA